MIASFLVGSADAAPCAYDFSGVTDIVQRAVDTLQLSGASLLVIKDDRAIYEEAFGAFTIDTVVPIASATKWISASVIMSLVDARQLQLDDPVSMYLPAWTSEMGAITIRQLLSHTSGLPSEAPCLSDNFTKLTACVEMIREAGLVAVPGTEFRYGGVSFQVAGAVAEAATGQEWEAIFDERLKVPLNLAHTSYGLTRNPRLGGGATSSLEDYGNLLRMHLNGGLLDGVRVLSADSVAEMQRDQTNGVPLVYTPQPPEAADRRYGLGEWRDLVADDGHAIQVSSPGAFGFTPWIDVDRKVAAVLLVESSFADIFPLTAELQAAIREIVDASCPGMPCIGDCNGDGQVTIDEIVLGVNIALDVSPPSLCTAFDADADRMVTVAELVAGVRDALSGCSASTAVR